MSAQPDVQPLIAAIAEIRKFPLAFLPTPLHDAPHLSEKLGVRVLLKRDDQTGLALGGNKARKLEFLIADALAVGADIVITTGGSQSNHARMTAAACRRAGLDCILVLDRGLHPEEQGNLLLDGMLGATVHWVDTPDPTEATARMEALAGSVRNSGLQPYVIPRGGSVPQGAVGYAAFVPELLEQIDEMGIEVTHVYLATGSTGTHSGVLAGLTASGSHLRLQGISVSRDEQEQKEKVLALSNALLAYLHLDTRVEPASVQVDAAYRGPGYGIPTPEAMAAIHALALEEGVFLDPVYTAKAMAGLIAHAHEGRFRPSDAVVFLHTGGAPALFAYHEEVTASLAEATR